MQPDEPNPYAPPAERPSTGRPTPAEPWQGVAACWFGAFAMMMGFVPIASYCCSALGLLCGAVGVRGPKKGWSWLGIALCLAALVMAMDVQCARLFRADRTQIP